jgi:tetratricopeptide (TPR) repeat protein
VLRPNRSSTSAIALAIVAACACGRSVSKEALVETGDRLVSEGKYVEAIIAYRKAITVDEKFAQAHAHLADGYLGLNDGFHALAESIRAADLLSDDDEAQMAAGRLLILARRFDDAAARAERVLSRNPRHVEAQILKGNAMLGVANLEAAIKDIQQAIANDPTDARSYAALGVAQMKKGQREQAESAFKRAVEAQPSSYVAQMALGHYYWATGQLADAEAPLKRAVEIAPGIVLAQRALITYYIANGRLKDAEAPLKLMAETVKTVEARLALADLYVNVDRIDEAVRVLKSVAREKEGFADATVRLAGIDSAQQRAADAMREVDAVLAEQPRHLQALLLKARLLAADGKLDDAIERAKEATVSGQRASSDAYYLLGMLHSRRNQPEEAVAAFQEVIKLNPKGPEARLQLAQLHLYQGAPQMAVQYAQEAMNLAPDNRPARLMLGRALTAQGEVARAEAVLQALAVEAPGIAAVHVALGELLLVRSELAAARSAFDRALVVDPTSIDALRGQISADITQHNTIRAVATIDGMLKKSPNDPTLLLLASQTYAANADQKRQEEALRRMLALDPTSLQAFAGLATLYLRQGKLEEARAEYLKIGDRQPSSVTAPTMVAIILEAQNKIADAQRAYEGVLADHPKAPVAANNLAWLYVEHGGNLDVALELAQTAKQHMPNAPEVDDTLGWIYYKKDFATLAVPLLESAHRADPKNATFAYHLGLAYAKAGERLKATNALEEALRLKPDFHEAVAAARALGIRD